MSAWFLDSELSTCYGIICYIKILYKTQENRNN